MIKAKDAVVWVNNERNEVMVRTLEWGVPEERGHGHRPGHWVDPIGAAYSGWGEATDAERVTLMLETVIDLAMQGIPIGVIVKAFSEIQEFHSLGAKSYPMCRALTSALLGKCLEPNTMSFYELLEAYPRAENKP